MRCRWIRRRPAVCERDTGGFFDRGSVVVVRQPIPFAL